MIIYGTKNEKKKIILHHVVNPANEIYLRLKCTE